MRGTILGYDTALHSGAIAGFDGQRYNFVRLDWRGNDLPGIGQEVDFVARGAEAADIYPIPAAASQPLGSVPSYAPGYEPTSYEPPSYEAGPPFTWFAFLFSFRGRINRSVFLLRWVLLSWILSILAWAVDFSRHPISWDSDSGQLVGQMSTHISWAVGIFLLWPHLATAVKRLHDRGRSGWFVLIALIPFIGVIWLWIETWFLPGTPGPNLYGTGPMRT